MMNINYLLDRYFIKQPRVRELATKLIYGSADTSVELLGVNFVVNKLRENGYFRAYRKSQRSSLLQDEYPVIMNLAHFAQEGGTFVDAGANIGIYSIFFSRFQSFFDHFEVHAFEASPETFRRLELNSEAHAFKCHNVALSDKVGELRFVQGAVSHVTTLVDKRNDYSIEGTEFSVTAMPLHAVGLRGNNIILKVDVEGQEYEVLKGAEPLFEERRIRALYLDGYSSIEVPRFLKRFGFRFFNGRTLRAATDIEWSLLAVRD